MFRTIEEFRKTWEHHTDATKKILKALTDESLRDSSTGRHRDIGRLAWHIAQTIPEMTALAGLKVAGPGEKESVPDTAAEIAEAYAAAADSLVEQVVESWDDATLQVEDNFYGQRWKRGTSLRNMINHEIHHRGQLTVLMRQAGLKVPGIYGPSREEWANLGMKEPEI